MVEVLSPGVGGALGDVPEHVLPAVRRHYDEPVLALQSSCTPSTSRRMLNPLAQMHSWHVRMTQVSCTCAPATEGAIHGRIKTANERGEEGGGPGAKHGNLLVLVREVQEWVHLRIDENASVRLRKAL